MNKKLLFYEVHSKYFKDYSGNGIGDLRGLCSKIDYFYYLGVDVLILSNIVGIQEQDKTKDYKKLTKDIGSFIDLQKLILLAKKRGIKIIIDLNIGTVSESHKWFQRAISQTESFKKIVSFTPDNNQSLEIGEYKYQNKTKGYYIIDSITKEVSLNWESNETMKQLIDVVKFWYNFGINGFIFTNFEHLNNHTNKSMTKSTLKELKKLYSGIKEIDKNIIVIGKTYKLTAESSSKFTQGDNKVFDYIQCLTIPFIGISEKFGIDVIGKFSQQKIVSELNKYMACNNNIITFGSQGVGRITSRWGDDGQFVSESAKSISMLLLSSFSSASIYYGDELGTKNIGLTNLDDFQDATIHARKRALASQGIKEKNFIKAQILQNPINAKSLMSWNGKKHGGFSISEKTITPIPNSYRLINVETQYKDKYSVLHFYKQMINMSKASKFKDIINLGSYDIKIQKCGFGVIEIIRRFKEQEIIFLINLTSKQKKIKTPKENARVICSTYGYKVYSKLPLSLQPYESIMVSQDTNNAAHMFKILEQEKEKEDIRKKLEFQINIKSKDINPEQKARYSFTKELNINKSINKTQEINFKKNKLNN